MLAIACGGHASAQETIKVAYTDPLSGPFAQVGDANLKQMQYIIDYINAKGGALGKKFELVPFDNKSQPSDALIALKSATDQNMPFIMQCSGSNIAAALIDGVNKHNDRNPDNRIIYLNCGAVAPELTNEQCSFWHFRFDLHAGMKAEVMVRAAAEGRDQGLPDQPGLSVRPVGAARGEELSSASSGPTCRSSVTS